MKKKKQLQVWKLILIYIVATGLSLIVFAYFHHVNPIGDFNYVEVSLPTPTLPSAPAPTAISTYTPPRTDEPALITPTPLPTEPPIFAPDEHRSVMTDEMLITENVRIELLTKTEGDAVFHIAEIWLRDVTYLKTYCAGGQYKGAWANKDYAYRLAREVNAFLAINGDQFAARREGVEVRNGVLCRERMYKDVAVLYYDGSLVTYDQDKFDISVIEENGAWQAWSFGPRLLDDNGQPMTEFNCEDYVGKRRHPRTAIGMIEPLHYIFVCVDGRSSKSDGILLTDLSKWFYDNGCVSAYNLDGGATSQMVVQGEYYNNPSKEREVTDIIYIGID